MTSSAPTDTDECDRLTARHQLATALGHARAQLEQAEALMVLAAADSVELRSEMARTRRTIACVERRLSGQPDRAAA
jgi:hypothetical protein